MWRKGKERLTPWMEVPFKLYMNQMRKLRFGLEEGTGEQGREDACQFSV